MTDKQATRNVTVSNREGVHLRAATSVVNLCRRYESAVWIAKGNHVVDAKSPLQLLGLGAGPGEALVLKATGPDADQAIDALARLFAAHFEETPDDPGPSSRPSTAEEGNTENDSGE
ncbi:MAG TPA: HPr family phosphocarrier protein [Thermoguttaceae bacterium]|nr:HPr family phosphocarrier protein [Thermoguttaceae bacterium]